MKDDNNQEQIHVSKEEEKEAVQQEEILQESTSEHKEEHRHHSHGHHHSHHHSHHKHSSKTKRKIKRFFRKNKHKLINIVACAVAVSLLVVLAVRQDRSSSTHDASSSSVELTRSAIRIESSLYTEELALVDDAVLAFMDDENTKDADELYKISKENNDDISFGRAVAYNYDVLGLPSGITVQSGVLEVSENQDYSQPRKFQVISQSGTVELYNLKTGTNYYYRLTLTLSNNMSVGTMGEFVTKQSPRILNIDGIKNVRDIGGWRTLDGKTIKQGMLYRGIELDGAVESTFRLSAKGLTDMVDTLGIRFDMDLRSTTVNGNQVNALGSSIPHKYYPIAYYSDVLKENNNELIRRIFSDLANKNNYPVYLHCTYGRDRTGTICYLLEGLLGVSKEDAYKEYQLTAFAGSYIDKEEFRKFQNKIDGFKGNTFQEKVEGYLLSVGVTAQEIQSIREIFLG